MLVSSSSVLGAVLRNTYLLSSASVSSLTSSGRLSSDSVLPADVWLVCGCLDASYLVSSGFFSVVSSHSSHDAGVWNWNPSVSHERDVVSTVWSSDHSQDVVFFFCLFFQLFNLLGRGLLVEEWGFLVSGLVFDERCLVGASLAGNVFVILVPKLLLLPDEPAFSSSSVSPHC